MIGNSLICASCRHETASHESINQAYCEECNDLMHIAMKAVSRARRVGVPIYGPSSWREVSTEQNLEHALTHVFKHKRNDITEDHLAHAICRLVMEYAK